MLKVLEPIEAKVFIPMGHQKLAELAVGQLMMIGPRGPVLQRVACSLLLAFEEQHASEDVVDIARGRIVGVSEAPW